MNIYHFSYLRQVQAYDLKAYYNSCTMAKDKSEDPSGVKKEKKEKKDKKRKHTEVEAEPTAAAEEPATTTTPADKPKKKAKKSKSTVDLTAVEQENGGAVDVDGDGDVAVVDAPAEVKAEDNGEADEKKDKAVAKIEVPLAALVPFANPLCDEKAQKKVLKSVKKGTSIYFHPPHSLCLDHRATHTTLPC